MGDSLGQHLVPPPRFLTHTMRTMPRCSPLSPLAATTCPPCEKSDMRAVLLAARNPHGLPRSRSFRRRREKRRFSRMISRHGCLGFLFPVALYPPCSCSRQTALMASASAEQPLRSWGFEDRRGHAEYLPAGETQLESSRANRG